MDWSDVEQIAIALYEARPDLDPLTVRFTDLRQWVLALEGFEGDSRQCGEGKLEAIQMAWRQEWLETI